MIELIIQLRAQGIYKGSIGVSKDCCGVCAATVEGFNSIGDMWTVGGEHGRAYMSLLSGSPLPDARAYDAVSKALETILKG